MIRAEVAKRKVLILITLDCWKRHFREKNYIENYFHLLKNTKSTKTTSKKCSRNIIWADFFGRAQTVLKHVWVRRWVPANEYVVFILLV